MAAFFFLLLAIIGGVLVGDLVWENTSAGEVTVFNRTVAGYPQGWLLATAAALGFLVGLLLVASLGSTKGRRARRRQLRSLRRGLKDHGTEEEHASWLDESFGRSESATHVAEPVDHGSEPLDEQTRRAARLGEDHRGFSPDQEADGSGRHRPPR
jgi:uncharacterized integral membrane protein